ncbi:hypothetical protein LTS18_013663 [Coniosporium uncinatum]|uniref:Uncharacterized protein n=1 Tax=Coniosporium uncinatum TaxID=93489 RepID=A0ACC3DBU6_9PEZI|nr:hypothetical protein LTS18_013663 [Coniosporium uncinatum]
MCSTTEGRDQNARSAKVAVGIVAEKDKDNAPSDTDSTTSGASTPLPDLASLNLNEADKHGMNQAFKDALAAHSSEEMRTAFWSFVKHDHPDGLLLRFLRARKWDVQAALVMMVATMHWRITEAHVDDDVMLRGEMALLKESQSSDKTQKKEGEDFMAQLRMGKSFLHRYDKQGRPMCFVRVRLHRAGEQTEASLERFIVYTIETARLFLRLPVDTATIVFDMTDFSMKNMDYKPVKFMIKCFEANYPELSRITRRSGKVHLTMTANDLAEYIDMKQVRKEMAGQEDWTYKYPEPVEGENKAMDDTTTLETLQDDRAELVQRYEKAILDWEVDPSRGKEIESERNEVVKALKNNYWKLDPYVRARSLYDRNGMLEKFQAGQEGPKLTSRQVETSADDLD